MSTLSGRFAGLALLGLALAACSSLLTETPRKLYRLSPQPAPAAALPRVAAQVLVEPPAAPAAFDTNRIALSRSPVTLDYFYDAEWTDSAPKLVQAALLEAFENSRAITAVDRDSLTLRADFVLRSELRHFEAVYDSAAGATPAQLAASSAPPQVWVALNVRLVDVAERTIVAQRTFEHRAAAAANDLPSIVRAFDEALGATDREIVVWIVANPALASTKPALPARR